MTSDNSPWILAYDGFEPGNEGLREALTSTGNGYFCTRGTAEWADTDDIHYPGTYAHGLYNRATTILAGRPIINEDQVNLPNWLPLKLRIEDEEPMRFENVEVIDYRHELDIYSNTVCRTLRFRDRQGRETSISSRRFVSMADRHQAGIEWTVTAENWSGQMSIFTALDGRVRNWGVPRYRQLEGRHLNPITAELVGEDGIGLMVQTRQSLIYIAQAARTRVYHGETELEVERSHYAMEDYIQQELKFHIAAGQSLRVEKLVAFFTSRDKAISEPLTNARHSVARYDSFAEAYATHVSAWDQLWSTCDVHLPRDTHVQRLVRFHIAHILQVCSLHTGDLDAGVPARGLNGEAYRGHIFWDELYIYPFLNYRLPDITRGLLMYRYRRLDEARAAAQAEGYRGAMYPWQSGSDGIEETQVVHLNPKSGKWDDDLSHRQRHVNAAIFYNIWQYYNTTGDFKFLWTYGAEMMLEIARFWSSLAHFNPERGRYEIHGVMGPDEFHEKFFFNEEEEGLRNNAYTNVAVAWMCETAQKILEMLPEARKRSLCASIGLTDEEIETWRDMSSRMFVPFHDGDIISQFEGYEQLEELDWEGYRAKYGNIQRLDRILKAEGDTPDRFKLSKQADTLMLFFLFPYAELKQLFEKLGYPFSPEMVRRNAEYYAHRSSHGSTLSYIVHASIEVDLEPEKSWNMFITALESDIGDIQGGTTREGIHMGVMAGTLDLIQRGFLGTQINEGVLTFQPSQLERLDGLTMPMRFRDTPLEVSINGHEISIEVQPDGFGRSVVVEVGGSVREISIGERVTFNLD